MNEKQRMSKMDVRAIISKLNQESKQLLECEIIAPLLPDGRIRTRLNGLIYEFKVNVRFVGWGRFRPINEGEAEALGETLPWERGKYLKQFPALRIILLWPAKTRQQSGMWWALPYNESDARQRFGFSTEPLPVLLCDPGNGAERFERVLARVDGKTLWFDGPDILANPKHSEWLRDTSTNVEQMERFLPGLAGSERSALLFWQIRQIELNNSLSDVDQAKMKNIGKHSHSQQGDWLRQEARRILLEHALQHALAKADATLLSFSEVPSTDDSAGYLMVEWSEGGNRQRYRTTIDPDLTIISSGICLSRRERDFDLTSLVSVMVDSPWYEV